MNSKAFINLLTAERAHVPMMCVGTPILIVGAYLHSKLLAAAGFTLCAPFLLVLLSGLIWVHCIAPFHRRRHVVIVKRRPLQ
jgi:hypothetical protein